MNLGTRLNNWLNIRYLSANNWRGQIGEEKGFCKFDTVEHGLRAAGIILKKYIKKGVNTPENIIKRYAPSEENDTEQYINLVCGWTGFDRDEKLTYTCIPSLMYGMTKMETGNILSSQQMKDLWKY